MPTDSTPAPQRTITVLRRHLAALVLVAAFALGLGSAAILAMGRAAAATQHTPPTAYIQR